MSPDWTTHTIRTRRSTRVGRQHATHSPALDMTVRAWFRRLIGPPRDSRARLATIGRLIGPDGPASGLARLGPDGPASGLARLGSDGPASGLARLGPDGPASGLARLGPDGPTSGVRLIAEVEHEGQRRHQRQVQLACRAAPAPPGIQPRVG